MHTVGIAGNLMVYEAHLALKDVWRPLVADVANKDNVLVTGGIFRCVRHPIYLGFIVICVGVLLLFESWFMLPYVLLPLWLVFYRIPREERFLASQFGEHYSNYSAKVASVLPSIRVFKSKLAQKEASSANSDDGFVVATAAPARTEVIDIEAQPQPLRHS
jgi:protein-S-isoprenylcysteine O-methyltransferase Ste14